MRYLAGRITVDDGPTEAGFKRQRTHGRDFNVFILKEQISNLLFLCDLLKFIERIDPEISTFLFNGYFCKQIVTEGQPTHHLITCTERNQILTFFLRTLKKSAPASEKNLYIRVVKYDFSSALPQDDRTTELEFFFKRTKDQEKEFFEKDQ